MKIIFFGTPEYVIPILETLHKNYKVVGVVTQPPRIAGRKEIKTFSAVDNWAFKHKLAIIRDLKEKLPEADLGIVAAYGQIIPKNIIKHFSCGILNIHPSLLPKYRGPSPTQAAIASGETQTGVTVIKMDELVDHGPIVSFFREEIRPDDTSGSLRERLFKRSAEFLITLIPNYLSGKIKLRQQDHKEASLTKIIKKTDGFVDSEKIEDPKEASYIERLIRAMKPWPGTWTLVYLGSAKEAKRLKLLKAHLEEGKLILDKVQLEGKKPVSWDEFKRGYPQMKFESES